MCGIVGEGCKGIKIPWMHPVLGFEKKSDFLGNRNESVTNNNLD